MKIRPHHCRTFMKYISHERAEISLTYSQKNSQKISPDHSVPILRAIRGVWREVLARPAPLQAYFTALAETTYTGRGLLFSPLHLLRYLGGDPALGNPTRWGRVLRAQGCPRHVLNYRGAMRNLTLYYVSEEQIQEWTRRGLCSTKKLDTHLPLG